MISRVLKMISREITELYISSMFWMYVSDFPEKLAEYNLFKIPNSLAIVYS